MHLNNKDRFNDSEENSFTEIEKTIARYMKEEDSTKQIAAKLGRSPHTIESHKKSMRKKSGAFTSVGVVVYALEKKIIQLLIFFIPVLEVDISEIVWLLILWLHGTMDFFTVNHTCNKQQMNGIVWQWKCLM